MSNDDDDEWFIADDDSQLSQKRLPAWTIIIADDDEDIHTSTRLALNNVTFEERPLRFISAYSAKQALSCLTQNPHAALILLDVMMEDEYSGLYVAKAIREQLQNQLVRIVLRTGGTVPEKQTIIDYEINDYKAKTKLDSTRLFTTVISALRNYRDLSRIEFNKRQFQLLALRSPVGIFQTDANGQLCYVNPQWQQIMGHHVLPKTKLAWTSLIFGEDQAEIQAQWLTCVEQSQDFSCECRVSATRWILVRANAVFSQEQICYGFIGTVDDISEDKQARQRLLNSQHNAEVATEAKSEFLAHISHELRTPLNSIIGYTEMIYDDAALQGQELLDLKKVSSAGKHLLSLINDVLDLSKIEAGKMSLVVERFPIAGFIQEVLDTVTPLAKQNGNQVKSHYDTNIGEIQTDMKRLWQILVNLLSNACKFTQQGCINLNAERITADQQSWVLFSICDTGIGLTEQQIKQLFQPFTQGSDHIASQYGGTGLGLVISQRFCQMMGGDITVTSQSGKGTQFTIKIPAILVI